MNKPDAFLFFSLFTVGIFLFVLGITVIGLSFPVGNFGGNQPASVFFVESSKPEDLRQTFNLAAADKGRKFKVLVVPGHDFEFWGTEFNGIRETDMTLALARVLAGLLASEAGFEVILARGDSGYNPLLASYFSENQSEILSFAAEKKKIMENLESEGKLSSQADGISHNKAPSPMVVRLYGINKWANENGIDLVVHIHFNDYPRRRRNLPGDYSGFAIYVPENQYSNARSSRDMAEAVSRQLKKYYPESNMPNETSGVVEDQDLIAIGSFNTLDPAGILIEYGYIYESQFLDEEIRAKIIEDLATQTYLGMLDFFGKKSFIANKFDSSLLPHAWSNLIAPGTERSVDVLSLQAALVREGLYPPNGFDSHDCPLTGKYGKCTKSSIILFQQKRGIAGEFGLGDKTLAKLNELYGQ